MLQRTLLLLLSAVDTGGIWGNLRPLPLRLKLSSLSPRPLAVEATGEGPMERGVIISAAAEAAAAWAALRAVCVSTL